LQTFLAHPFFGTRGSRAETILFKPPLFPGAIREKFRRKNDLLLL
jgi:hypothetical protein